MKQICLGTIITLIYQSRTRSADTIKSVCRGIFCDLRFGYIYPITKNYRVI